MLTEARKIELAAFLDGTTDEIDANRRDLNREKRKLRKN